MSKKSNRKSQSKAPKAIESAPILEEPLVAPVSESTPSLEPPTTQTQHQAEKADATKEKQTMSEKKKTLFPFMDMNAGFEMFNQFAKPFGEAMQANMEQVQKLQEAWMTRTQEAVQQSQEMFMEGVKQSQDTMKRFYDTAQEQVQRFTK